MVVERGATRAHSAMADRSGEILKFVTRSGWFAMGFTSRGYTITGAQLCVQRNGAGGIELSEFGNREAAVFYRRPWR